MLLFYEKFKLSFARKRLSLVVTAIRDKNSHTNVISYIHHWMIWYCTKICCSPLQASWDRSKANNFLLLGQRLEGWKKTATIWIPYAVALRVSFAVLAVIPSVTFTNKGMLTTDCCLFTLACTIFLTASFYGIALVRFRDDFMLVYNRTVSLRRAFVDKYGRADNSLDVYRRGQLPLWALSWAIGVLLTPLLLLLLNFYSRDTPLGLSYYLVSPALENTNWETLLHMLFVTLDWTMFMAMTYSVVFMVFNLAEVVLIFNAAITFIRGPTLMEHGRKEKRHCYNQLQLLVSQFNTSFSNILPSAIYAASATAVVAATFLLRPDCGIAATIPGLYPLMFQLVAGNTCIIFPLMRYLETMKMESEGVLKDVELLIVRRTVWARKDGTWAPTVNLCVKRVHKLRLLRIKFGQIRYFDEGMMTGFAMAFVDNVVNLVFMVDIRNSSWLLKLPR